MVNEKQKPIEKRLDALIALLQLLLALELSRSGLSQGEIGKRLHVAKETVGEMLKGVKKEA